MPPKPLPGAGSRALNAELEEAEDLALSPSDAASAPSVLAGSHDVTDSINPSPVFTNAPQDSDPRTPRAGRNVKRRRLSLDPPKKTHATALIEPSKKTYAAPLIENAKTTARPSPSGGAEDDLREKGLEDPRKIGSESDKSKRSSSSSSRSRMLSGSRLSQPGSPASQGAAAVEPRPKVDLYGGARPREEVLKGWERDPRKISESNTSKRSSPSSSRSRMLSGYRLSQPGSPASQGGAAVEPRPKLNLYGGARPREEVLKGREQDLRKISESNTSKRSSPSSSRSRMLSGSRLSQPGSPASQGGAAVEPRPKVDLYGGARPREEVLKGRGLDPSKIDSEFWNRSKPKVNWSNVRQVTEGKKLLTEEINHQKAPAEELNNEPAESKELTSLCDDVSPEETQLDLTMHQSDDQVRSDERSSDDIRPGSGAGRSFRCSIL